MEWVLGRNWQWWSNRKRHTSSWKIFPLRGSLLTRERNSSSLISMELTTSSLNAILQTYLLNIRLKSRLLLGHGKSSLSLIRLLLNWKRTEEGLALLWHHPLILWMRLKAKRRSSRHVGWLIGLSWFPERRLINSFRALFIKVARILRVKTTSRSSFQEEGLDLLDYRSSLQPLAR